jgi:hypothetical protein
MSAWVATSTEGRTNSCTERTLEFCVWRLWHSINMGSYNGLGLCIT